MEATATTTKFRTIDNFSQKVLNDKKYLRHCDIDLFVNLKLTGLLNYFNLLSEDDIIFMEENYKKNKNVQNT